MSKSKAILITAFEPFGGESINPSQQILNELPDIVNGYRIEKVLLPVEFIEAPSDALGVNYTGKTCIGCIIKGVKDGKEKTYFVYNVCDHAQCFKEVEAQAVSYTTGVPAMIGTKMIAEKTWQGPGVFNMEEFDPDPFMRDLNLYGLPWQEIRS